MKDAGPTVAVEDTQGSRGNMAQARGKLPPLSSAVPLKAHGNGPNEPGT